MSRFKGRLGRGSGRQDRESKRREALSRNGRSASRDRSDCHGAVMDRVPGGGWSCRACGNGCQVVKAWVKEQALLMAIFEKGTTGDGD